jgi:hypothetical protein
MVYNTTQHPPSPTPHSHTLSVQYILYIYVIWEGGGGEVREKVEGQQSIGATVHKLSRKYRP